MTRLFVIVATLMVAGCGGVNTAPPVAAPQEVKIPVAVPCKAPEVTIPAFAVDALGLGAGVWDQMAALRAERLQRKAYEAELEAALNACR